MSLGHPPLTCLSLHQDAYATQPETGSHAGVVYGWDKECERDPDWAAAVQADPNQPFYHVLPDEGEPDLYYQQITSWALQPL